MKTGDKTIIPSILKERNNTIAAKKVFGLKSESVNYALKISSNFSLVSGLLTNPTISALLPARSMSD